MVSFETEIVSPAHYCGASNYGWNKNEKFMVVHDCVFHPYSRDNSSEQLTVKLQQCKRYSMDYHISETSLVNWFSDNFQWRMSYSESPTTQAVPYHRRWVYYPCPPESATLCEEAQGTFRLHVGCANTYWTSSILVLFCKDLARMNGNQK